MSLDNYYYEPFQDDKEHFEDDRKFETESIKGIKKKIDLYNRSIFKYFLDGSRKLYKIGDIITTDNKFVPVVAGQVGAACCMRDSKGKLKKYEIKRKNLVMLYDSIQGSDFNLIKESFEKDLSRGISIEIKKYSYDKIKDQVPVNAAIAKIQRFMHDMEIELLKEMVENRKILSTDKMLVIDGSLQFLTQKFDPRIFYNVTGISKTFNPNLTGILKGKRHIGVALAKLEFRERTPVYRYKTERNIIGAWYLRIREKKDIRNPLEGVVKIEKMAMQEDIDRGGFESSIIDNISASILAERNPTCHGNDKRWPNHLYPIYLTEKILKASFLSDIHFINIF